MQPCSPRTGQHNDPLPFDPPARRRGKRVIENCLHRHNNVNFGEDASLIHTGQGPTAMDLPRNASLSLLHQAGVRQTAARLRTHRQHPERAVALVVGPLPAGA